jgi:hypothetical protein
MRVQRGIETAQDLINAFPVLEQASCLAEQEEQGEQEGIKAWGFIALYDAEDRQSQREVTIPPFEARFAPY